MERRPDDPGEGADGNSVALRRTSCLPSPAGTLQGRMKMECTAMLIAFKLKLAAACVAGLAGPLAVAPLLSDAGLRSGAGIEQAFVEVRAGNVAYRVAGDFTRNRKQAAAPLRQITFEKPLAIMKHQVSSADYQACVNEGACRALDRGVTVAADRPAVQVSWHDANAYAAWLSHRTGEKYRLPTDEEW